MTDAEKALAHKALEYFQRQAYSWSRYDEGKFYKIAIEAIQRENTANRDTDRIRAYAEEEITLNRYVQDLQHQVNKLTDERFQLYQDLDEVRERDKAATSNYNLMLEHLTEEKRIQDAINQAWATDARKEYKTLKEKAQGLLKVLRDSQEQFEFIYESLKGETTDEKTAIAYAFAEAGQDITYAAISAFKADEIEGGK